MKMLKSCGKKTPQEYIGIAMDALNDLCFVTNEIKRRLCVADLEKSNDKDDLNSFIADFFGGETDEKEMVIRVLSSLSENSERIAQEISAMSNNHRCSYLLRLRLGIGATND